MESAEHAGMEARSARADTGNAGNFLLGAATAGCCTWAALNSWSRPQRTYYIPGSMSNRVVVLEEAPYTPVSLPLLTLSAPAKETKDEVRRLPARALREEAMDRV